MGIGPPGMLCATVVWGPVFESLSSIMTVSAVNDAIQIVFMKLNCAHYSDQYNRYENETTVFCLLLYLVFLLLHIVFFN